MEKRKPFTAESYLKSIQDNREVWVHGQKVNDVTSHRAFKNLAKTISTMYDRLHDEEDKINVPVDNDNGTYTHPFYKKFGDQNDLRLSRKAIHEWQKISYGWIGRSPDYKGSFIGTIPDNLGLFGEFADHAKNWYDKCQNEALFLNHAIVNPPVDRNLNPSEVKDVFVHVVEEKSDGIVVSGAKVVATSCMVTHYAYVSNLNPAATEGDKQLMFVTPIDAEGVKLICRTSYEYQASKTSTPFDYPLSSRFDENDAIIIFDKTFIPWENVLTYTEDKNLFMKTGGSGFTQRVSFHSGIRFGTKLDFISGLLLKAIECSGVKDFRGVQRDVGEVLAYRNMIWGLVDSMTENPTTLPNGTIIPNHDSAMAFRVLSTEIVSKIRSVIFRKVASNLIYLNSSVLDFDNPEISQYLNKYLRGSNDYKAIDRVKLMKLLWDATGSEFAGRHELYEMNYSGNDDVIRTNVLHFANASGQAHGLKSFVEKCMNEYDTQGWKTNTVGTPLKSELV